MGKWLVVGISGVTSGGKSTLAKTLHNLYPNSRMMCMDKYFLADDDARHVQVTGLNHHNWERLGAIDIESWQRDIKKIVELDTKMVPNVTGETIPNFDSPVIDLRPSVELPILKDNRLLILDGFLALNDPWTAGISNVKFYITLTKEQCWERRQARNYDPPDIPGYFEKCVWPEHLKMKAEVVSMNPDVVLLDGSKSRNELLDLMLQHIGDCVSV